MKQNYPNQYMNDCAIHREYENNYRKSDDALIMQQNHTIA